jgi:Asp-tRNA(Asn)/Glu-tRNA(Gln) amidotransferase A subunit family amidase
MNVSGYMNGYVLLMTDIRVDDPEAYHGAPVAVQVVGRRLTEERIMEIAEEIGKLLGNEITP